MPAILLVGELPGLVAVNGVVRRPTRPTLPWLLLARLALPRITESELPIPPARDAAGHVSPATVAQVYRQAAGRASELVRASRADLPFGARGMELTTARHELALSQTALANVRQKLNALLDDTGRERIPAGRGTLALVSAQTDVDAFFELLASGSYGAAIDAARQPDGFPSILTGVSAHWLVAPRLLYNRGLDGAFAELAADADGTEEPDVLERAVEATERRIELIPRLYTGGARAVRERALATLRESYLRRLRAVHPDPAGMLGQRVTFLCCEQHPRLNRTEAERIVGSVWEESGGRATELSPSMTSVVFPNAGQAARAATVAHGQFATHGRPTAAGARMALHTGSARLGGRDQRYAARLCSTADWGEVLVSDSTAGLLDLPTEDLGEHSLRGFPTPRRIFQLHVGGAPADPRRRRLRGPASTNVTEQRSSFVGRRRELDELTVLLGTHRLMTLTGPGGVGKTRMALQVAADLLDQGGSEVWLVDFAPITDDALVTTAVRDTLGVLPGPKESETSALVRVLSDRDIVLLLDNCDHVTHAAGRLAGDLLASCAGLSVIATSREPLQIADERVYRVGPLDAPPEDVLDPVDIERYEAVRLLAERARAQRDGFAIGAANALVAARICRRLDGLPLAIELAAARLGSMSLANLDHHLDDRFALLTGGSRSAPERHHTLRAMLDWSLRWLSVTELRVLLRLSVFAPGGFDLEAARAVCGTEVPSKVELLDALGSLVSKSLVQFDEFGGVGRYWMLETIREFAAAELSQDGTDATEDARRAHRRYYAGLADAAALHLAGPEQLAWFERLTVEQDNLRAALANWLDHPEPGPGLRMAAALGRFWRASSHAAEGARTLAVHLGRADAGDGTIERGLALAASSLLLGSVTGEFEKARVQASDAQRIAERVGDRKLALESRRLIAVIAVRQGRFQQALELCDELDEPARELGDLQLRAELLNIRGAALVNLGMEARGAFEGSLRLVREMGDLKGIATALNNLGAIAVKMGDLSAGEQQLREALAVYRELGLRQTADSIAINLGLTWCHLREEHRARSLFTDTLRAAEREADPCLLGLSLLGLAITTDEPERAATVHGAADAMIEQIGYKLEYLEAPLRESSQAGLRQSLGDDRFEESYRRGRGLAVPEAVALATAAGKPLGLVANG